MPDTILKRWNGSSFEELYPKTTVGQISASGTASSSTFLRGDGQWVAALPLAGGAMTNLSGTTSQSIYFDTAQTFTGPYLRGQVQDLYRGYYTSQYKIWDNGNSNVWEPLRTRVDATDLTTTGANGTTGGSISTGITLAQGDTIMMEVSDTAAVTTGNTVSVVIFTLGAADTTPTSITQGVVYRTSYSSATVHYDYFFKVSYNVTSLYFDDSFRITFTDTATATSIITQTGVTLYVGRVWRLLI